MDNYLDKTESLTPEAKGIICDKKTEYPHSGIYNELKTQGSYICRRCGWALFRADSQFASGCGWPSFDVEIDDHVKHLPDLDGIRTEIVCKRCDAHLGHVFKGEHITVKNTRYCVNSLSIDFVANGDVNDTKEAIVAGGCFWGVEHLLGQMEGVLKVESGYTGGTTSNPSYDAVCSGHTGHLEAVRVVFDTDKTDYQSVIKRFFEIHDPTQSSGQEPDIGSQYQSAVFYFNETQKHITEQLIQQLKNNNYDVVTKLIPVHPFWAAEAYHQNYYVKNNKQPYCHSPVNRFEIDD